MTTERFRGFDSPNYTPVPDQFFDELMADLSEAELRVLLYIMRRTFGFKKHADAISITQLVNGIAGLDTGTGMHRSSVLRGCKGLVAKGVITVAKVKSETGDYETNVYALRFAEGVGAQSDHRSGAKRPPVGAQSDPQETGLQQTDSHNEEIKKARPRTIDELIAATEADERLAAELKRRQRAGFGQKH